MHRARILAGAVLILAAVSIGGCSGPSGADPAPSFCDGISAEMGGCRPDRPVFTATDCHGVAAEWTAAIERLVTPIFTEPAAKDGKAKSVRISDALILSSVLASGRLTELGLLGTCTTADFLDIADATFHQAFRGQIGGSFYDGEPVLSWDQFLVELERYIKVIDVETPEPPSA